MFTESQFCMGRCICPFGALSVDYADLPDEVKSATERFMSDSVKWLTRVLETGREQGEFSFEGDPEQKAISILAALQGARQIARIQGVDTLQAVIQQVRTDIGMKE